MTREKAMNADRRVDKVIEGGNLYILIVKCEGPSGLAVSGASRGWQSKSRGTGLKRGQPGGGGEGTRESWVEGAGD